MADGSDVAALAEAIRTGDRAALPRAITLVESTRPDHREQAQRLLLELMPDAGKSLHVGITGVPGAGGGEQIVNIAFPVADHRDHGGVFERFYAFPRALDPAPRLLILERPPARFGRNLSIPLPDAPPGKPDNGAAAGIGRKHGMNEKAKVHPVTGRSKPAHAPGMGLMVDLARILDRKHMPAGNAACAVAGHGLEHSSSRYTRAVEKARVAHLARVPAAKPPEAHRAFGAQPPQQIRAPFLRRKSPK